MGCRWVNKIERNGNGDVKYKARLVAQEFSQKYEKDYDEVFTPVVRQSTLLIRLAVAGKNRLEVCHYDAKPAFSNGKLKERIFIRQPPGYQNPEAKNMVRGGTQKKREFRHNFFIS